MRPLAYAGKPCCDVVMAQGSLEAPPGVVVFVAIGVVVMVTIGVVVTVVTPDASVRLWLCPFWIQQTGVSRGCRQVTPLQEISTGDCLSV